MGNISKESILDLILQRSLERLNSAKESYQSALDHSRSDDMKSEGKYDTRAIEAGYLASAKKQRMDELEIEYASLQKVSPTANDKISLGSLALLERRGKELWHFFSPASGEKIQIGDYTIVIISINSPLSMELMGLSEGDSIDFESPQGDEEITILKIL